jgi:exopolysaccharide biosynthesis polyprenyl glycosylphosphotransferase
MRLGTMSIQATLRPSGAAARAAREPVAPGALPGEHWPLLTAALLAFDGLALTAAFALAYLVRFKAGLPLLLTPSHDLAFYSSVAFWAIPAWLGLFAVYRLYDRRRLFVGVHEYGRIFNACTAGLIAVMAISFLDVTLSISRGWLLLTWCLSIGLVCLARFGVRRLVRQLRRRGWFLVPTVIVGANEEGKALAEQFLADAGGGTRVVGFVDTALPTGTDVIGGRQVLGSLADIQGLVGRWGVRELVIAPTALARHELLELYQLLGHHDSVRLRLSSGLFEVLTTGVEVQESGGVPLMTPQRVRITGADALLKSTLDYAIAATALLLLAPLLLILGLLVKLDSRGPILYRRRVLGRAGKPFDAFKFRTMIVDAERRRAATLIRFPDRRRPANQRTDPRVTRFGRFLRRTSLDELPQLLNVLRGQMSLVGPRMIAPDEAAQYGKWQLNLVTVKPGITGPWQVRGRSDLAYDERVRLSMHYIRNYSLWLDLEILLRTVGVVLKGKGAY